MPQILLVDNLAETGTMLRLVLEGRGYHVSYGRSGEDGLKLLQANEPPDLIICNMLLAGMDGLAFLEQVRRNRAWSSIPFVMMSPVVSQERKQAAFQQGADAFLSKPFHFDDLNNILCNLGVLPERV